MNWKRRMNEKISFPLENGEIDRFSEMLETRLEEIGMERQNRLRIRLSLEEALLRFRDHFKEPVRIDADISYFLGKPHVQIALEGTPYNPLSRTESELDDWNGPLLTSVGLNPQYNYAGNRNILRINFPGNGFNPTVMTLIAAVAGILIGFASWVFVPADAQETLRGVLIVPVYTIWRRILNAISGPVIFFMVTTSVLNMTKVAEQGGSGTRTVLRYFWSSLYFLFLTTVASLWCFGAAVSAFMINTESLHPVLREILKMIPGDIITPFIEANTPQLLIMAVTIGTALNIIGIQAKNLARIIKQMNMVGMQLAEWIGRISPFVIILLGAAIWEGEFPLIFGMLKCVLFSCVMSVAAVLAAVCRVSLKEKVSFRLLLKKLKEPFFTVLRKGSVEAAYGQTEYSCITDFGIDRTFTTYGLPHGLVFYMPASAIGTLMFTIYAAKTYDVKTSVMWFVMAMLLTVILTAASPPIQGAGLLSFIGVFGQLGLPSEALLYAAFFDLFFGIFASAANLTLLQAEMVLQADGLGLLNKERLRRDHS